MKRKYLFIYCFSITLILVAYGCKRKNDNNIVSSDGVKIYFNQIGSNDPTIIFIHGWSNNRTIWDAQMSYFSKKYRVMAVDLPGFGESKNNRTKWTMKTFGEDVEDVIRQLDIRQSILVGFSMGGPAVLEAASKIPDRVIGVVLVDALQDPDVKYPPQMISYIDSLMMDMIMNPTKEKMLAGGFIKKNPDESYKRGLNMFKDHSKIGWSESLTDFFNWSNNNLTEVLKKTKVPLISVNSDNEPTNVEGFRKYIPTYQAKIISDVGHVIMWDNPEEFNRSLEESIKTFITKSNSD
jgi:pimeloyl-ACP methyl ester carboxylesterase